MRSIRNAFGSLHLLALAATVALSACAASPEREDIAISPAPLAEVQLVVSGSNLTVIFVSRAGGAPQAADSHSSHGAAADLQWELLDSTGDVIDSGTTPDPRVMRSEQIEGGAMDSAPIRVGAGVVRLQVKGAGGTLRLLESQGDKWVELGRTKVAALPEDGEHLGALIDLSSDVLGDVVPLVDHGDATKRAKILIVPEGYTEAQLGQFHTDAKNMAEKLSTIGQYADYWDGFNLYMQDIRSKQSGVADPVTGANPVTAFEVTFGDDKGAPRRCTFYDSTVEAPVLAAVESLRKKIQADAVVVLANTDEYGGCASPANKLVIMTRNAAAPDVLAHELGHSLFNLADEYGGNSCNYTPNSPNIAANVGALPWKDLLTTNELPTDPAKATDDTVGAFDGAGYCDHGFYRPSKECMMRSLGHGFCPVCAGQVQAFFQARGLFSGDTGGGGDPGGDTTVPTSATLTLHNQTGGGLFARCSKEVGAGCSDWTWMWPGDTVSIETSDPGRSFYIDNSTTKDAVVPFSWQLVTPGSTDLSLYANTADPLSPP
jgi:hypothetical protein